MPHGDVGPHSSPSPLSPAWAMGAAAAQPAPLGTMAAAPFGGPQHNGLYGLAPTPIEAALPPPAPVAGYPLHAPLHGNGLHGAASNGVCAPACQPATYPPTAPASHGHSYSGIPQGAPALGALPAGNMPDGAHPTPEPRDLARIYAIFDAQSEARSAASAIEFNDRERAIAHLQKALVLLATFAR